MPPKMPLEIAQCARDKLHASAREIWSSIRSLDDLANNSTKTSTLDDEGDSPKSKESAASMSLEKLNDVFKVMFGSCTTGMPDKSPSLDTAPSGPTPSFDKRPRSSEYLSSKDIGEHVYEQLFMDDHARAAQAVDSLRQRVASSPQSRAHQCPQPHNDTYLSGSPPNASIPTNLLAVPLGAPPTTQAVDIKNNFSFDDGISAISAHTLDEMARVHDKSNTNLTSRNALASYRKHMEITEDVSHPILSRCRGNEEISSRNPSGSSIMSPLKFSRGRSYGTHGSKATKSSKSTKSTNSTQDSEFANVWRKEEMKYWDDVVEEDRKTHALTGASSKQSRRSRRRSRCGSSSVSPFSNISLVMLKFLWSS